MQSNFSSLSTETKHKYEEIFLYVLQKDATENILLAAARA